MFRHWVTAVFCEFLWHSVCIFISAYLSLLLGACALYLSQMALWDMQTFLVVEAGSDNDGEFQTEIILTLLVLFSTVLWRWIISQQIHNTITWNDSGRQMAQSLVHILFCYYCCCYSHSRIARKLKMNAFNSWCKIKNGKQFQFPWVLNQR